MNLQEIHGPRLTCCATFVCWALTEAGYEGFEGENGAQSTYVKAVSAGFKPVTSYAEMKPGDILFNSGEIGSIGHTQLLGRENKWYNGGGNEAIQSHPSAYEPNFTIAMRPYSTGDPFEGYIPGQYVVSPASGEVIESGITERINQETGETEEVGFIKIRTLEHSHDKNNNYTAETSDLVNLGLVRDQRTGEITSGAADRIGYGYFLNEYESVAAGYTIYIDGFDPALIVDYKCSCSEAEKDECECTEFTSEYKEYKQQLTTEDGTTVQIYDAGKPINLYTPNESGLSYSAAVKRLREKLEKEEEEREKASPFIQNVNGKTYIKEGTVIGITRMNQVYTEEDIENLPDDMQEYAEVGGVKEGNYIRIVMRDKQEDAVVENIEDYMEIEEEEPIDNQDILIKYIWAHESGAVYNYLYAGGSYTSYVARYITEDKQNFICYTDYPPLTTPSNRNFGPGVMHKNNDALHNVEHYASVGVNNLQDYCEVGVSQMPVDTVAKVQLLIVEAKESLVRSAIGDRFDQLSITQQHCLIDIAYQGCSTWGDFNTAFDASGGDPQYIIDNWPRLTSTASNNSARADARRELWLNGRYTDASGNDIK